jgi:tetratricopeptide (TPR) repeat protein
VDCIERALADYSDHVAFELFCCRILDQEGFAVDPRGGSGDRGRDAIEGTNPGRPKTVFQFSLENIDKKLKTEITRFKSVQVHRPKEYVYTTNKRVSAFKKDEWSKRFANLGIRLHTFDLTWLSMKLGESKHAVLRSELLGKHFVDLPGALSFMLKSPLKNAALQFVSSEVQSSLHDTKLDVARALLKAKAWKELRDYLEDLLTEPRLSIYQRFEAFTHLGNALFELSNIEGAKEKWNAAQSLGIPNETPTGNLAGVLFLCEGKVSEAEELVNVGLSRSPRDPSLLDLRGLLMAERGDAGEAIKLFEEAYSIMPRAEFLLNRWAFAESLGNTIPQTEVNAALVRHPDDKGLLLFQANRHLGAFQATKQQTDLHSAQTLVLSALSRAIPVFDQWQGGGPPSISPLDRDWAMLALNTHGAVLYWQGQYERAEHSLRLGLAYDDIALLRFNLAQILVATGRMKEGLEAYAAAKSRGFSFPDLYCQIGNVNYLLFRRTADPAHAKAALDAWRQGAGTNADILASIAQLHWELGNKREARNLVEKAVARNPRNCIAKINRVVYSHSGDPRSTLPDLKTLEHEFPQDPNLLTAIGDSLFKCGNWEAAFQYLNSAIDAAGPNVFILEQAYPLAAVALKRSVGGSWGVAQALEYLQKGAKRLPQSDAISQTISAIAKDL